MTSDPEQDRASFKTRLVNFEALDVRILNWAEHVLERLEDGIDQLDIGDKQLLYEETEAEVRNQQLQIFENIQQGEALIRGNNVMTLTFQKFSKQPQVFAFGKFGQKCLPAPF